jgi:glutamate transport system substrate-binding protein
LRIQRSWILGLTVAALLVAGACGSSKKSASSTSTTAAAREFPAGSTMARLKAAGKMTVGTKFDQPLFGLKNPTNGQIEGFDVELAKLIAKRIDPNLKLDYVETVSKNREPFIQEGKVDIVVATYTINDTRKQVVDFAGPYYVAGQDIMVKKDNTTIKGVEDLNGKKVCSVQGSTSIKNVQQKAPQADLGITFDTYSKCADALADGRVVAVTTDNIILLGIIKDRGDFKLVGKTFTQEPYGVGLKKGDDQFRTFINDVLEEIYRSGEWKAAFDRTVGVAGEQAPTPPPVNRYTSTPATTSSSTTASSTTSTTR